MNILTQIFSLNWLVTLRINFHYFPFLVALRFPVHAFGRFSVHALKGEIHLANRIVSGMIRIGTQQVGIFDKKRVTILNIHGNLYFNGTAELGRGTALSVGKNSTLRFGDNFVITGPSSIVCSGGKCISIGRDTLFSWNVLLLNTDFHQVVDQETNVIVNPAEDILVGNNVWIGCDVKILKGTTIADHCIVGANSLVCVALDEPHAVYAGQPAKRLRGGVGWRK